MGLFSKKKKGEMELPPPPPKGAEGEEIELPELPPLPEEPAQERLFEELPPLPELPVTEFKAPVEEQIIPKRQPLQPLFISMDDYRFILDGIGSINKRMASSQETIEELERIRTEEDKLLEEWKNKINDIEKKLSYIDKAVIKTES